MLDRVLTPRTAGFTAVVEGALAAREAAKKHVAPKKELPPFTTEALYDFTFAYDKPIHSVELGRDMPPSVLHYIGGAKGSKVPRKLHIHVKRVPLDPAQKGADPLLTSDPAAYVQRSFEVRARALAA